MFFEPNKGVTTFYDSVCGVPLFRAPVNRTLEDLKADTDEHGWRSFRADYASCSASLRGHWPCGRGEG